VETHPNRNLRILAVCFTTTLLFAAAAAKLLSRNRTGAISEASQRQAGLTVSGLKQRLSKSTRPSSDQNILFDPILVYSTYLGGPSTAEYSFPDAQSATVVQPDASGNLYVAGYTNSPGFPVTTSALVSSNSARNGLGFLAKLDPTGHTLLFSTYINGITVSAMAIDPNGDIYLAGGTGVGDASYPALPIPSGSTPYISTPKNIGVLKLNSTATAVVAATYLGGSGGDRVTGIALKPGTTGSNLYVTGTTQSNDLQTTPAPILQATLQGNVNGFVTVLNPALSSAIYSTYLGSTSQLSSSNGPRTIAVDTAGNAYVVGSATAGFPISSGALQTSCPDQCGFVAELNPTGSALIHSTYFGTGGSTANAIAVDASQNAYIEGHSNLSTSIPTMNPVPGFYACSTANGVSDFISEISAAGSVAFSSCVSSANPTIFLDSSGNISITGFAFNGFPLQNPIQSTASNSGGEAAYVATINPTNGSLVFSSYLGDGMGTPLGYQGSSGGSPTLNDIAIDASGNLYGAGYGFTFPVFNALQPVASPADPGSQCANPCVLGSSVAILKIAPTNAPAAALEPAALTFSAQALGAQSAAQTVNVINLGSSSLTVSNVTATGDFAVQDGCTATVAAAGGTCALQVTFTPTATGNRTGSLSITDTSAGSPHTVQLTGVGGQASVTLAPTTLSFSQAVNTTGTSQVTLDNSGTLPLQISSVQISGTDFSETNACGISVPAGQSCVINVSFSPTALGNSSGTLTVTDSAAGSPQTVALTGKGVAASLGLAYATPGGSSAPTAATVQAGTGATTLIQVGGAGLAGSVTLSCSGLPQGATCDFNPSTVQMFAGAPTQSLLVIQTTARSLLFMPIVLTTGLTLLALCLSILYFGRTAIVRAPRLRWRLVPLFALAICACGGGNGSSPSGGGSTSTGTPAGSHIITITATSGSSSQTLLFNLTVQ
jgi:Abnormal spindle-like microcephaly-assoc'd, ASPM-SPD-2-Hydin/Beta-propeller repeat